MRAQAPLEEMAKYIALLPNVEERATLAVEVKCFDLAVQALVQGRDRQRLEALKARSDVAGDRALVARIDSVLRNPTNKWRS